MNTRYYGELFATRDFLAQVSGQVEGELGERLQFWSKHVNKQLDRKTGLKQLNAKMGERVRSRVIGAYKASRISKGKSYRYQDRGKYRRFSNGAMLRTLNNKSLIVSDKNGLYLYNFTTLDDGAKQWYRLNFGASPRGKRSAGPTTPMKFFGIPTGIRVNLDRFGPSPAFPMPAGFWSSTKAASTAGTALRKGNTALYPVKLGPVRSKGMKLRRYSPPGNNRGIQGTAFLDQGLTLLNEEYPRRLERLTREWLDSGL